MRVYFWSHLFCEAVARILAGAHQVAIFILNPLVLLSDEVSVSLFCTLCVRGCARQRNWVSVPCLSCWCDNWLSSKDV